MRGKRRRGIRTSSLTPPDRGCGNWNVSETTPCPVIPTRSNIVAPFSTNYDDGDDYNHNILLHIKIRSSYAYYINRLNLSEEMEKVLHSIYIFQKLILYEKYRPKKVVCISVSESETRLDALQNGPLRRKMLNVIKCL